MIAYVVAVDLIHSRTNATNHGKNWPQYSGSFVQVVFVVIIVVFNALVVVAALVVDVAIVVGLVIVVAVFVVALIVALVVAPDVSDCDNGNAVIDAVDAVLVKSKFSNFNS